MDPSYIGANDWAELGTALRMLWLTVGCVIIFAFSILTAHAIIPSLVSSRHIPQKAMALRKAFYSTGALALVGIVICVIITITSFRVVGTIWDRWLI